MGWRLMRTHCIADQPPALRHQARKLAFILPEEAAMAQKLDIAFWNYDRTRLLADGSVKIEGADAAFHSARIAPEIFEAMIRRRAYDVSELGMTYFLRTIDDDPSFLAIPVFPNRCFRHSAIYINKASGIERPEDLVGKKIGELAVY